MAKKIDEGIAAAFARIKLYETAIIDLHGIVGLVTEVSDSEYKEVATSSAALSRILFGKLNDAYRHLLMWSHLSQSPEAQRGAEIACKRYLDKRINCMGYLDMTGCGIGSYMTVDREQFEAEIAEAMREKFGVKE